MLRIYTNAVVIITGAASGIGRAMSIELARRGAQLVLLDIQEGELQETFKTVSQYRDNAEAHVVDVTEDKFHQTIKDVADRLGRIDFLFNNAGIGVVGDAELYEPEFIRKTLSVNFNAVIESSLFVYPIMKAQGFGHIVNTASLAGLVPVPWMTVYSATKHGLVGFSKSLRAESAEHGVRVTALCPGVVTTAIIDGGAFGKIYGYSNETIRRWVSGEFTITADVFAPKAIDAIARNPAIAIVPRRFRILYALLSAIPDSVAIGLMRLLRNKNRTALRKIESAGTK